MPRRSRMLPSCAQDLSQQGYRVLAVAYRSVPQAAQYSKADEHDLVLLGFLTFADDLSEAGRGSGAAIAER